MVLGMGGGSGGAAGRTHSVLPSVVMTKRCVPKYTEVPGTNDVVVLAIRSVLGEVERRRAKILFLACQLSMFSTPASKYARLSYEWYTEEHRDLDWFGPPGG